MVIARILRTLWKMLSVSRRAMFSGLCVLLCFAGLTELLGMLVLFGYIQGLHVNDIGHRSGRLAKLLEGVADGYFDAVEYALWGGACLVGAMVIKHLFGTLVRFLLTRFLTKLNHRICTGLFEGYMRAPYERLKSGQLGSPERNVSETFEVFSTCFHATSQVLADGSLVVLIIGLLFLVEPWLTLGAAAAFILVGTILYRLMEKQLVGMGRQETFARMRSKKYLKEGFAGLAEARLRGVTGFFVQRYGSSLRETTLLGRRKHALARLPRSFNELLLAVVVVGAVLYITLSGSNIQQALPTLGLFGFAGLRFSSTVSKVNVGLQNLRQKAEAFDRCYEAVLAVAPHLYSDAVLTPENDYLKDEEPLPEGVDGRLHEEVRLRDVSFTYSGADKPSVEGVSLTIPRGSFAAFCGPSGGGKSTLLMLLMGLLKPSSGTIECDGRDVFKFIRTWHKNIGYVGQHVFIASTTVRQNVAFGIRTKHVDDKKVWQALKQAAADEFVRQLPQGLSTELTDNGAHLSGGERQRITIARALYHDPEVIVFDEATAALDNVTEREITDALVRLSGQKTIICVAHRLSTIRGADKIHFVEDGKIAATGTYDELLEHSPHFRRLAFAAAERKSEQSVPPPTPEALPKNLDAV